MFFSSDPYFDTPAEALVVPVRMGKEPATLFFPETKLFRKTYVRIGESYLNDVWNDAKNNNLRIGNPTVHIPDKNFGQCVINFPIPPDPEEMNNLASYIDTLRRMFELCEEWDIENLAIADLENGIPWEILETSYCRMEQSRQKQQVALWIYPPEEEDEKVTSVLEVI